MMVVICMRLIPNAACPWSDGIATLRVYGPFDSDHEAHKVAGTLLDSIPNANVMVLPLDQTMNKATTAGKEG